MTTVCNGGGASLGNSSDYAYDFETYEPPQIFDDFMALDDLLDLPTDLLNYKLPSIQGDVAKIAANSRTHSMSMSDIHCDINNMLDVDIKPELRNADCMWSVFASSMANANNNCTADVATSSGNNNNNKSNESNSAASSYSDSSAVPPAVVTGSTLIIKQEPAEEEVDEEDDDDDEVEEEEKDLKKAKEPKSNNCQYTGKPATATISIPQHATRRLALQQTDARWIINAEQHIPPGASLLRKSITQQQLQQQQQQQQQLQQLQQQRLIATLTTNNKTFVRPDTPQSAYDESILPEFRHNVDLRACVMGSNNISLTSSADANYIDHLSRELQNTSKERIDLLPYRMSTIEPQINDVLDVLSQQSQLSSSHLTTVNTTVTDTATAVATVATTLSPPATTATSSDCDSDDGDCSLVDSSSLSASLDGNNSLFMRHISDHSYTRCNEMETDLPTPSDSDEEIDVVSLNDKKLPTNPSDRDRRALQTKVAHKISNGARALPPPRRGRFELPYTPASSSPVKSVANSRYPSPSSTPYQSAAAVPTVYSPESLSQSSNISISSNSSSSGSDCTTTPLDGKSRKRYYDYMPDCTPRGVYSIKSNKSFSSSSVSAKKSRVKKVNSNELIRLSTTTPSPLPVSMSQMKLQSALGGNIGGNCSNSSNNSSSNSSSSSSNASGSGSMLKRQFSVDEADTIEKRNLHNDMERQRRIGLKNLFEALKKQIPNIRDKERAPKVNILREAAKLCEQLTSEERELSLKRQLVKARLKQHQERLARLRLSKNGVAE